MTMTQNELMIKIILFVVHQIFKIEKDIGLESVRVVVSQDLLHM